MAPVLHIFVEIILHHLQPPLFAMKEFGASHLFIQYDLSFKRLNVPIVLGHTYDMVSWTMDHNAA